MTFTNIMTGACFFLPLMSAFGAVHHHQAGKLFYPVALIVGIAIGFFSAWALRSVLWFFAQRSKPWKPAFLALKAFLSGMTISVFAFAWAFAGGFAADLMMSKIIHLIAVI
jgi:hypothetical protein